MRLGLTCGLASLWPPQDELGAGELGPNPAASFIWVLSAGPSISYLRAWNDLQVVGSTTTWGQHHLRGQELLLCLQPVPNSRSLGLVQQQEVASSHPQPRPLLQQRLPNSAFIVSQQPSVHLQEEWPRAGEGHSGQFWGQKLGNGL